MTVDEPVERRMSWTATLTASRWGPVRPPALQVTTSSGAGLRTGTVEMPQPVELVALPRPATVVVVDSFTEAGLAGASTLDASLRGAAGLARVLLTSADRVGLVVLGGIMGWLTPATSSRQWYRTATSALGVAPHQSYVTPDINRIPPVALPPGSLVILFSPLLDPRTLTVIADLRRRRFDVPVQR